MIQKIQTKQDTFQEVDDLRRSLEESWGINKREEILRLLYEIARREDMPVQTVYQDALSSVGEKDVTFRALKQILLERRFPRLHKGEQSQVLLTPVKTSHEDYARQPYDRMSPSRILIEKKARDFPLTKRILDQFPEVPQEAIDSFKHLRSPKTNWSGTFGKDQLLLTTEEFDFIKPCACTTNALVCNYYVLNLGFGCPYDCSYCYLQFYQNTPAIVVDVHPEKYLKKLDDALAADKSLWTRIGTGEHTDSLALDWLTEYSKVFVPYFKDKPVYFELKTKSDEIENLLELNHGGRTVVAWSLNPSCYEAEESKTAPLARRLEAARRVQAAGYPVAFHFDPIFYDENWEGKYEELVHQVYDTLIDPPKWLSLGMFRYHRDLKKVSEFRHPETRIFLGEQTRDDQDDKFRYPKRVRETVYRKMLEWIRLRDPDTPIYLCMESPEVWKAAFEKLPYSGRIDTWIVSR